MPTATAGKQILPLLSAGMASDLKGAGKGYMSFPGEILFPGDDVNGAIRLKVAAICACIDNAQFDGAALEEEIEPFTRSVEVTSPNGKKYSSPIDPHAFLYIQPTGNLEIEVNEVLDALKISIDKGQLKTVFLRVGLDGIIDVDETWVLTKDFAKWCTSRGIERSEVCEEYDDGEFAIFSHAIENGNDKRKEFEAPFFDANYAELNDQNSDINKGLKDRYETLLLENMRLRGVYYEEPMTDHSLADRPMMTRERNTLLIIIAALCKKVDIDLKDRKSVSTIVRLVENVSVSMSDDTIREVLKKIPDAVGARVK
jgi:hypothetical protein